jgi:CRISPR-associated protein Cas1
VAWRSVVISKPAKLKLKNRALLVEQEQGAASVPLEDIAAIVIDQPQVTLTAALLVACAERQVAIITVDDSHTPNGIFLAHTPHSRALKIMRGQLAMSEPHKKRLWQLIVKQKIANQAQLLAQIQHPMAQTIKNLAVPVRSGDPDNFEAQAAQVYFPALFGKGFTRDDACFANAALNYGYAIVRSAIARSLVAYGFLPAFGLHHCSELNAFNLADDIIEPYRILVDARVSQLCQSHATDAELTLSAKTQLVNLLHEDVLRLENGTAIGSSSTLALIDASIISLGQSIKDGTVSLVLPALAQL